MHSLEDLANLLSINLHERKVLMTTITQATREKYMQQGMQQKKLHIARNMLTEGFALNIIQRIAGMSEAELRQLKAVAKG